MPLLGRYIDRKLFLRVGRRCQWQQAILAPQQRSDGRQDYTVGDSRGYLYSDPVSLKILLHGDSRDEAFQMEGAWEKGSATGSAPAHHAIGDQDKITVLDYPIRDSLQLTRGSGTRDEIRQRSVVELLRVHDGTNFRVVDVACQLYTDANDVSYVEWLADAPTEGTRYTILMNIRPVWIVMGHPMVRGFSGKSKDRLPWKLDLKRYDHAVVGGV